MSSTLLAVSDPVQNGNPNTCPPGFSASANWAFTDGGAFNLDDSYSTTSGHMQWVGNRNFAIQPGLYSFNAAFECDGHVMACAEQFCDDDLELNAPNVSFNVLLRYTPNP